jgi:thymidylate synthase (FAD)
MLKTVNLIGITQPTEYSKCKTANELVAYTARVSNPGNQHNLNTAGKLVKYLVRNQHWSPLEMVSLSMEIKTTRDISRQILRHRSFYFQEFSQRYAVSETFITNREARLQDNKNRQNSIEHTNSKLQASWESMQEVVKASSLQAYKWALNCGIAKEQARSVLPEGLTDTTIHMHGTLRSWVHYCDLRSRWDTQKEHRLIAVQAWEIISEHFPDMAVAMDEINMDKKVAMSKIELVDYMEKHCPELLIEALHSKSKISLDN